MLYNGGYSAEFDDRLKLIDGEVPELKDDRHELHMVIKTES